MTIRRDWPLEVLAINMVYTSEDLWQWIAAIAWANTGADAEVLVQGLRQGWNAKKPPARSAR